MTIQQRLLKTVAWMIDKGYPGQRVPEAVKQERLQICEKCELFKSDTRQCSVCSCFMDVKASLVYDPVESSKAGNAVLVRCAADTPKWPPFNVNL
jgi:hypothetical protein